MNKKNGQQKIEKIMLGILLPNLDMVNKKTLDKAWQKMEERIKQSRKLQKAKIMTQLP